MRSIGVVGKRPGSAGHTTMTVEPSVKVSPGVFVHTNLELATPTTTVLRTFLAAEFEAMMTFSGTFAAELTKAGGLQADTDMMLCPEVGHSLELDAGTQLPGGDPPAGGVPPGEPLDVNADRDDRGRVGVLLYEFDAHDGDRVRSAFLWNNCSDSTFAATPAIPIGVDFDLFLFDDTHNSYVYSSQSNDDNREGFDVELPSDSHYQIWASWPQGNHGCDNDDLEAIGSYLVIY